MDHRLHEQLMRFFKVSNELDAVYSHQAAGRGLSDSAFWVLYSIWHSEEAATPKSICEQWSISKQTVHSSVKSLENKGFIRMHTLETDKRSKYITLTEKGEDFAKRYLDRIYEAEEKAFLNMSETSRQALIDGCQKYLEGLKEGLESEE